MKAQNNTLGLNSNLVSAILTIADNLRGQYKNLGATGHQMPRNPYPMHKLVINALPTSKKKAMSLSEIQKAIKEAGYHVSMTTNSVVTDYPMHLQIVLTRLVKNGSVQRFGSKRTFRYWFAL